MANYPLPQYENIFGTKKVMVIDVQGPSSYVNGTGAEFFAANLNWGGFDFVVAQGSVDGSYIGRVVPVSASQGSAFQNFYIRWFALGTGTEVTNTTDLSGEYMRIFAIGL